MSEKILKSLKNLQSEIGKVYGECYCANLDFTADRLKTLMEELMDIERGYESETNEEVSEEYESYFIYSMRKSIDNKEDMRYLSRALNNFNAWADVNGERRVGMEEFKYLLENNEFDSRFNKTSSTPCAEWY